MKRRFRGDTFDKYSSFNSFIGCVTPSNCYWCNIPWKSNLYYHFLRLTMAGNKERVWKKLRTFCTYFNGSFRAKSTRPPDMTISDFDKYWYGSFWVWKKYSQIFLIFGEIRSEIWVGELWIYKKNSFHYFKKFSSVCPDGSFKYLQSDTKIISVGPIGAEIFAFDHYGLSRFGQSSPTRISDRISPTILKIWKYFFS